MSRIEFLYPLLVVLLSMFAHAQDRLTLDSIVKDGVNGVDGLEGVWHSAISPDGNHLYAAGFDENKIAVFQRNATTGALTFVEVLENGVNGVTGLGWVGFILVSPDGDYVYAASWNDDAVVVFSRNSSSGELTFLEVHVDLVSGVSGINRATSIAMSQDGQQLYVTGNASNAVATFDRDPSTGLLTYVSRYLSSRMSSARSVVVSPDDAHVYVGASFYGAINVFDRDPSTGALTFNEVHEDGVNGVDGLSSLFWITLSDDGAFLYAASPQDDAIGLFSRNSTTGKLTFIEMYKDNVNGVEGLNGATSIAISPDGNSLIATAQFDGLTLFDRDPATGQLTFVETHDSVDLNYASGAVFGPAIAPASPAAFFAPPTPLFLYIAAAYSDAVNQWTLGPPSEEPTAISNANFLQASTHLDPINTFNGELFSQKPTDLDLGGPMPLTFGRYYSSYLRRSFVLGDLGSNWRHNFDARLFEGGDGNMKYVSADGRVVEFIKDLGTGAYDQSTGLDTPYQLSKPAGLDATLYDPTVDRIYTFDFTTSSVIIGKLTGVEDGYGNIHTITYDLANGQIDTVSDGLGRQFTFTYNNDLIPKISVVSDGTRSVSFEYTDPNDDEALTVVTDARGFATTYTYENTSISADHALMLYMTRPEGNAPFVQTFFDASTPLHSGKVKTQSDADGNTFTIAYNGPDTTLTDPLGNTRVHTHTSTGEFSNRQDEMGQSFSMGSDIEGRRTSINDRLGNATSFDYHAATGRMNEVTNADTGTTTLGYSPRAFGAVTLYDLTGITHADGSVQSMSYDSMGNLISHVDQAGNATTATHDANGLVLTITNAAGGISTNVYNADETPQSAQDPSGNTTTYAYDAERRMNLLTHADGSNLALTFDAENTPLSVTDENGNSTAATYDDNGNLLSVTDALGAITSFAYDGNDRVISVTDPFTNSASMTYDPFGRVGTVTDENGNVTALSYDIRGRLTAITDSSGNLWSRSYDAEAVLSSITDPLSNTTSFVVDSMGRVTQITSPLGFASNITYDLMGRVASTIDAKGNITSYEYEVRGQPSRIVLPGGYIETSLTYDVLGNIDSITDPNGNSWLHNYDNSGRRASSTDPLGNVRALTYDIRNRLDTVTFPGGLGTLTMAYDPASNVTGRSFSDGTVHAYTYDANNRPKTASGIALTYDDNGRISDSNGITHTRDAVGRITAMTLAPGKTVTYSYNANDRMTQVTDWVGGATTFAYDAAGNLTSISRPNGVTTTRAYDNDGRLTDIAEGILSTISLVRDMNGQITGATRDVPVSAATGAQINVTEGFDDAAQRNSAAYDALGRIVADGSRTYDWDLASNLTGYSNGGDPITATYDAMGLRLSRVQSGVTTSFVWNYALGMVSTCIEKQNATDARYYVHTPGGSLIYSVDANSDNRRFYHFDEMGNTNFVTNDAGDVIGSYAYSPFGVLLAESGGLDSLFTWQGQQGVMTEVDNLYYARARFYDSSSARFLSRDLRTSIHPNETNPYQYAMNNPLSFVDPMGTRGSYLREAQRAQEQRWSEERAAWMKESAQDKTRQWLKRNNAAPDLGLGPPTVRGIAESFLDQKHRKMFESDLAELRRLPSDYNGYEFSRVTGNLGFSAAVLSAKDPLHINTDIYFHIDPVEEWSAYDVFNSKSISEIIAESNARKAADSCKAQKSNNESNKLHAPLLDLPPYKSEQENAFDLLMEMLFPTGSIVDELQEIVILC